jgi:hypothetical protein
MIDDAAFSGLSARVSRLRCFTASVLTVPSRMTTLAKLRPCVMHAVLTRVWCGLEGRASSEVLATKMATVAPSLVALRIVEMAVVVVCGVVGKVLVLGSMAQRARV